MAWLWRLADVACQLHLNPILQDTRDPRPPDRRLKFGRIGIHKAAGQLLAPLAELLDVRLRHWIEIRRVDADTGPVHAAAPAQFGQKQAGGFVVQGRHGFQRERDGFALEPEVGCGGRRWL